MMNLLHPMLTRWRLLLIVFSLVYAFFMLCLDGGSVSPFYGGSFYHRLQADALLDGHFYLADSIEATQLGLAWYDGKVQQVWGLGVGMLLVPFEAVCRFIFRVPFPERIALGIGFAVFAYYSGLTCLRIVAGGNRVFGLGFFWILILCPALWTLARYSQLVFEETVLYAILISLAILVSLVRISLFRSRLDYLLCCALSSFVAWIRPTHCIYGLCGVVIGSIIICRLEEAKRLATFGTAIWLFSISLLAGTNNIRFGSPIEFGHRFTISSGSMVYLTRFGNPFEKASLPEAAEELFGALFLNTDVRGVGAFVGNQFRGQASLPRWRRFDLTAYDLGYVAICAGAIICLSSWYFRFRQAPRGKVNLTEKHLRIALFFWSAISIIALSAFYLHFPVLTSRYLLDFAPAMTAFLVLIWDAASRFSPRLSLVLLAMGLAGEIAIAKTPKPIEHQSRPWAPQIKLSRAQGGTRIGEFNGRYTVSQHPTATRIAGNGNGWDPEGGFAAPTVSIAVDAPKLLELTVSVRRKQYGEPARRDSYRAQIEGKELSLRQVEFSEDEVRVLFDVPDSIRARSQNEMIFLCFVDGYDSEDRNSERILYSVRWK